MNFLRGARDGHCSDQVFVSKTKSVQQFYNYLILNLRNNDHTKYPYLLYTHLVTMATMMTIKGINTDMEIVIVVQFHSPKIIMQW